MALVINYDLPTPEAEHHYQKMKTDDGRHQNRSRAVLRRERMLHPLGRLGSDDRFWVKKAVDEYVHRIGRTGRVGNPGKAISFYDSEYSEHRVMAPYLVKLLLNAKQEVPAWLQKDAEAESEFLDLPDAKSDQLVESKVRFNSTLLLNTRIQIVDENASSI